MVVSEERVGSSERIVCVCWRDETTSSTFVLGGVDREREEASVITYEIVFVYYMRNRFWSKPG